MTQSPEIYSKKTGGIMSPSAERAFQEAEKRREYIAKIAKEALLKLFEEGGTTLEQALKIQALLIRIYDEAIAPFILEKEFSNPQERIKLIEEVRGIEAVTRGFGEVIAQMTKEEIERQRKRLNQSDHSKADPLK